MTMKTMTRIKKTKNTTIIIKSDFFQYESKVFLLKTFETNLVNKVPLKLSKLLLICKKLVVINKAIYIGVLKLYKLNYI